MKHVRVRMTAGGREGRIHPMYDVLANAEFVERATALQWNFTGDTMGMLHYVEGDADAFEQHVSDVSEVVEFDVESAGTDAFYTFVRGTTTALLRQMFTPTAEGKFVVVPPIVYHEDGTVSFSAFGLSGDIQGAIDAMPDPVDIAVEEVGGLAGLAQTVETRLSDRQREAASAALALGYYDIPREASHEEVAEEIGCAPSTAAEHLRKAESKVLRAAFAGYPR